MKYTIELTNKQKAQMDCIIEIVHRYVGFNPKLEMIETTNVEDTNEYEIGYKTGYDKGYYDGYDKCLHSSANDDYEKGKLDGLEEFENLFINEYDYEQFFEDTYGTKDPDYNLYDLVAKYGAKKVVDDLKKWKEKKKKAEEEIKVGDVIYSQMTDSKAIIISFDAWDNWNCIDTCGTGFAIDESKKEFWKKIGHFGEVEQLLDKLRGEEE